MKTGIQNAGTEQKIAAGPFARTAIDIINGRELIAADSADQTTGFLFRRESSGVVAGGIACRADWDIGRKQWAPIAGVKGLRCSRIYVPTVARQAIFRAGTKEVDLITNKGKNDQGQAVVTIDAAGSMAVRFFNPTTGLGRIAFDPAIVSDVVMSKDCLWYKIGLSGGIVSKGSWPGMKTGEKFDFMIVPRPGKESVWHCALNGFSTQSSSYSNSVRRRNGLGPVVWANYKAYPSQGDDLNHIGLGQFPDKPTKAIIGGTFRGAACVNVWTGKSMMFNPDALFILGEADQEPRHGIHFATTTWQYGGESTWAVWKNDGEIMIVDVMKAIHFGVKPEGVARGSFASAHAGPDGTIVLVYTRDNALYRRTIKID